MIKRNIVITDVETTGFYPEQGHVTVQIAATAINCVTLKPHHAGSINLFIKPTAEELALASPKALEVAKHSVEKAKIEGVDRKVAYIKYFEWLESINADGKAYTKPIMAGHNSPFDMKSIKWSKGNASFKSRIY